MPTGITHPTAPASDGERVNELVNGGPHTSFRGDRRSVANGMLQARATVRTKHVRSRADKHNVQDFQAVK
jgi:hypothetical protein